MSERGREDLETAAEDAGGPPRQGATPVSAAEQARLDAEAVRLGRFMPLGMIVGAGVGTVAGWISHRFGICVPVGIALGILLAGTLPVFGRRRSGGAPPVTPRSDR